jgi:endonuclease/exonuclease/phosphatase family metal-dependent hydrolase
MLVPQALDDLDSTTGDEAITSSGVSAWPGILAERSRLEAVIVGAVGTDSRDSLDLAWCALSSRLQTVADVARQGAQKTQVAVKELLIRPLCDHWATAISKFVSQKPNTNPLEELSFMSTSLTRIMLLTSAGRIKCAANMDAIVQQLMQRYFGRRKDVAGGTLGRVLDPIWAVATGNASINAAAHTISAVSNTNTVFQSTIAQKEAETIVGKFMRRQAKQRQKLEWQNQQGADNQTVPINVQALAVSVVVQHVQATARRLMPAADIMTEAIRDRIELDPLFGGWSTSAGSDTAVDPQREAFSLQPHLSWTKIKRETQRQKANQNGSQDTGAAGGRRGDVIFVAKEMLRSRVLREVSHPIAWMVDVCISCQDRLRTAEPALTAPEIHDALRNVLQHQHTEGRLQIDEQTRTFKIPTVLAQTQRWLEHKLWSTSYIDDVGEHAHSDSEWIHVTDLIAAQKDLRDLLSDRTRTVGVSTCWTREDAYATTPSPEPEPGILSAGGPDRLALRRVAHVAVEKAALPAGMANSEEASKHQMPAALPPEPVSVEDLVTHIRTSSHLLHSERRASGWAVRRLTLAELEARAIAGTTVDTCIEADIHRTATMLMCSRAEDGDHLFRSLPQALISLNYSRSPPKDSLYQAPHVHRQQSRKWVAAEAYTTKEDMSGRATGAEDGSCVLTVASYNLLAPSACITPTATGNRSTTEQEHRAALSWDRRLQVILGEVDALASADVICLQEVESTLHPADAWRNCYCGLERELGRRGFDGVYARKSGAGEGIGFGSAVFWRRARFELRGAEAVPVGALAGGRPVGKQVAVLVKLAVHRPPSTQWPGPPAGGQAAEWASLTAECDALGSRLRVLEEAGGGPTPELAHELVVATLHAKCEHQRAATAQLLQSAAVAAAATRLAASGGTPRSLRAAVVLAGDLNVGPDDPISAAAFLTAADRRSEIVAAALRATTASDGVAVDDDATAKGVLQQLPLGLPTFKCCYTEVAGRPPSWSCWYRIEQPLIVFQHCNRI